MVDVVIIYMVVFTFSAVAVPLTHPLTASQALAREKQKKDLICNVAGKPRLVTRVHG